MNQDKNKLINFDLPLLQGLLPVRKNEIGRAMFAGLTLVVIAIPTTMGYARIAGMPIIAGIYTLLLPMIVFAIFGTSRHLVVAADSATAAILAQGIIVLAAAGTPEYMNYVYLLALMVGVLLIICRILRFGFISKFLSRTVLVGFLSGVGIQISLMQIGGMMGFNSGTGGTIQQLWNDIRSISQVNTYVLAVSIFVLILILVPVRFVKYFPWIKKVPWTLIAIVLAIMAGYFFDLPEKGVPSVGIISGEIFNFSIPSISIGDIISLLPIALAIVIVTITQSAATSAAYANRYGEKFNANTDLLGLGVANIAAGLSGAFVVNGSPTQTQAVDESGGRSQLANVCAAAVVIVVLLFLTKPLQFLPNAALSALVFTIGLKLVDIASLKRIYKQKPNEFAVALLTVVLVVIVGAAQGIIIAMGLSLIEYLRRSYHPKNSLMTPKLAEDGHYMWTWQSVQSCLLQPSAGTRERELLIYHFAASIYYANADVFAEEVMELIHDEPLPKNILLDFSAIADVDFTGGQVIAELFRKLTQYGIKISVVHVDQHVIHQLSRYGIIDMIDQQNIFKGMSAAVKHLEK